MSFNSVVLTGSTGSVGAATLEQLLNDGKVVKAVIRSKAKSQAALEAKYIEYIDAGKLTFYEVPDMTKPNAFDDAVKGYEAFIHVATSISSDDFLEKMIKPAWKILENVLDASAKSKSIKRVIVTGSIVATMRLPDDLFAGKALSESDWNSFSLDEVLDSPLKSYQYSKTSSEQNAWKYMAEKKPPFDLIFLLVPSITGRFGQTNYKPDKTTLGGQSGIYRELFDRNELGTVFPFYMDTDDVASVHVKSLDTSVNGNERYLFHAKTLMLASDLADGLREHYPHLKTRIPAGTHTPFPEGLITIDTSKSDRAFGELSFVDPFRSAKNTVDQILAYERAARA